MDILIYTLCGSLNFALFLFLALPNTFTLILYTIALIGYCVALVVYYKQPKEKQLSFNFKG